MATLSLRHSFKKILQKDNLLLKMIDHMESLNKSSQFTNIVQGDMWKKKAAMYPNQLVIPYFLYSDDIELNNPLGAHSTTHTVTNFYFSFPVLPNEDTKLDHIFLAASIKSSDLQVHGIDKCLLPLVNQLIDLEVAGIEIDLNNGKVYNPHFLPCLIIGDNLGLNTILGYRKSFSGTFCRLCRIDKNMSNVTTSAIPSLKRTYANYRLDVNTGDPSKTGIVSECVFNKIPSFHVVDNLSVDAMHDVFEGICHYDLSFAILYFTNTKKYFSLKTLNARKQKFDYGELEIGNISPKITITHLKNRHLKMSAKEMMTFLLYFPLIVGDMIPDDDEVWIFILTLIQIVEKILKFSVTEFSISSLENLIEKHNKDFIRLFKTNLKPKYHLLVHYPEIIRKCGPVRKFWSFQFESKHRSFKLYTHAITSRKNICFSLEKKYQFTFSNFLLNSSTSNNLVVLQKDLTVCELNDDICAQLKIPKRQLYFYNKVILQNIVYKKDLFVAECEIDYNIYRIINVFCLDNHIYIFGERFKDVVYCSHYRAFEIHVNKVEGAFAVNIKNLIGHPTTAIKTHTGKYMIRIKELY
ncbi:uncharacterized protein LOC133333291 [Musca vetustissima]|uniref:uncharacterized protein LOC133333291 n=2 Tax=Musca vetustissima TaxID=27455 RepID=UPI002AB6F3A3|nr:uncharacterized protein LOC133333291 [Musca vetustissima]